MRYSILFSSILHYRKLHDREVDAMYIDFRDLVVEDLFYSTESAEKKKIAKEKEKNLKGGEKKNYKILKKISFFKVIITFLVKTQHKNIKYIIFNENQWTVVQTFSHGFS